MKKIMTLLIAMVAMFGLNSCEVFNEVKDSPWIEYGWDDGKKDLHINFTNMVLDDKLTTALDKAIESEGFVKSNQAVFISTVAYTNSEAKSVANRIVKKVNIDQYESGINLDFVVRYRMSDSDKYTEVYRKNLCKKN